MTVVRTTLAGEKYFIQTRMNDARNNVKQKRADLDSNQDLRSSLHSELNQLSYPRKSGGAGLEPTVSLTPTRHKWRGLGLNQRPQPLQRPKTLQHPCSSN